MATSRMGPERQIERARFVLDVLLKGYAAGEITFEDLARVAKKVAAKAPQGFRRQALGSVVWRAVEITPARRRRGQHGGVRAVVSEITRELVGAVSKGERWGPSSSRTHSYVRELWGAAGVTLTLDQIRDSLRAR